MKGELVWEGKDYTDEKQWTLVLTEDHLVEIDDALKAFRGLNKPIEHVSQQTFPLPTLSPILRQHAKELQSGRGLSSCGV